MSHILFHIPHSSLTIPKMFWSICVKDLDYIKKTNLFLSDYLIDKLVPYQCNRLKFKYSRIFCDVEKFKDDYKETMAKKGMGVVYIKDCENIITVPNKKYKNIIIKSYYNKYHNKLNKISTNILNKYGKCIIIDLHSYSDEMVKKLFNSHNNPDICIGVDPFYTDENLIKMTIEHFKKYGYSVEINKPYVGTIIPNKYINTKDTRLKSIMLEINKRIYLNNENDFFYLKNCLNAYYQKLLKYDKFV